MPTKDEIENKLMELLGRCEMKKDIVAVRKYIVQLLKEKKVLNENKKISNKMERTARRN